MKWYWSIEIFLLFLNNKLQKTKCDNNHLHRISSFKSPSWDINCTVQQQRQRLLTLIRGGYVNDINSSPYSYSSREEWNAVQRLREMIRQQYEPGIISSPSQEWLQHEATEAELVRFLRARDMDINAAYQMLHKHSVWRKSPHGCDSAFYIDDNTKTFLRRHMYFSGMSYDNCVILVVESIVFEYAASNIDVFVRYFAEMIEVGHRHYGLGAVRKLRLLIDRSVGGDDVHGFMQGTSRIHLLRLLRKLCSTLQNNYPEMLEQAHIYPVSGFFRGVYSVFSHLIKPSTRTKIVLVSAELGTSFWQTSFPPQTVPAALGGVFRS